MIKKIISFIHTLFILPIALIIYIFGDASGIVIVLILFYLLYRLMYFCG